MMRTVWDYGTENTERERILEISLTRTLVKVNTWFPKHSKYFITYQTRVGKAQTENMLGDQIIKFRDCWVLPGR